MTGCSVYGSETMGSVTIRELPSIAQQLSASQAGLCYLQLPVQILDTVAVNHQPTAAVLLCMS